MKITNGVENRQEILSITYHSQTIFEPNSWPMKPHAREEIGRIAHMVRFMPYMTIDIHMSTRSNSTPTIGDALRTKRLAAVKECLLQAGAKPHQIAFAEGGSDETFHSDLTLSVKALDRLTYPAIQHQAMMEGNGMQGFHPL